MSKVRFYKEEQIPLEMHKVRVVQKLTLLPVEERLKKIQEAGNNTFLLQNKDVYMDMLTDSGVNAMSDQQVASMGIADDSYAGSETFNRVKAAIYEVFGTENVLPAHQGRAMDRKMSHLCESKQVRTLSEVSRCHWKICWQLLISATITG